MLFRDPKRFLNNKIRSTGVNRIIVVYRALSALAINNSVLRFGPWQTVYFHFCLWSKSGVWRASLTTDADMRDASIDSTLSKVHQHAAGAKKDAENAETNQDIGLSRGGPNTKIHTLVDALGNPTKVDLSPGNINDCTIAVEMLSGITFTGSVVLGDKAYGTLEIRQHIENQGVTYCIPPKSNAVDPWECDYYHYKERHVIEYFYNKLKQYRRVATRYDKLSRSFLSFVLLASIIILLK